MSILKRKDRTISPEETDELKAALQGLGERDRLIVVRPTRQPDEPSYVERIYQQAGREPPFALYDWDAIVDDWCDEYRAAEAGARIVEVLSTSCVYVYDRTLERMVVAYAVASLQPKPRDKTRIRRFPDVSVGIRARLGDKAFDADRGHYLLHAAGGELDINLFPQQRDLNQGRSAAGRRFREMERYAASEPGTFFFHRPLYDDETWIPSELEFGVLVNDSHWWIERFANKP